MSLVARSSARRGITTQAGADMADKGFQMDKKQADKNKDGKLSEFEEASGEASQKALNLYHGGMPCGCDGECDGSCMGMMTDPESGNPIPLGSTAENVRDDIEANISEGEYVLPADVVKWHGLKHIMDMQMEAKMGLMGMSMDGFIQHAETESSSESTADSEVSDAGSAIEEKAEEDTEAQDFGEIEVAGVTVEEDGETEEIYPEEESLNTSMMPGILKKDKFAFIM